MAESSLIEREVALLRDLAQDAKARAAGEKTLLGELGAKGNAIAAEHASARREIEARSEAARRELERAIEAELTSLTVEARREKNGIQSEYEAATKSLKSRYQAELAVAKQGLEDARWQATAVFESASESAKKAGEADRRSLADELQTRLTVEAEAEALQSAYRRYLGPEARPEFEPEPIDADPRPALSASIHAIDDHIIAFDRLKALKLLRVDVFVVVSALILVATGLSTSIHLGWPTGAAVGLVSGLALIVGLRFWLVSIARRGATRIAQPLRIEVERSRRLAELSETWVVETARRRRGEIEARRTTDLKNAEASHAQRVQSAEAKALAERRRIEETYPPRLAESARRFESARLKALADATRKQTEALAGFEAARLALDAAHEERARAHDDLVARHRQSLNDRWTAGSARVMDEARAIAAEEARLFPSWDDGWPGWNPPREVPPVIRVGHVRVDPSRFPNGIPSDERLRAVAPSAFDLPTLLDFRSKGSLLIRAGEGGRDEAVDLLQAVMLRMLTAMPPAKVRFTIIDAVGLGQSFASFMHLADFDEAIINHRIWTDNLQIEQRLKDLTDHMENVIQTYLRNDYQTIEDYNAQAGEVAEPYRVLVVANFPAGFSEAAIKSLASVVNSGARCGVHTLISVDTRQPLPFGLQIRDIESNAVNLIWRDGRFVWRDPLFEGLPFVPDRPPTPDAITGLLHDVGKVSKDARRVEVPFEVIAPADDRWWTADSRAGIDVPLGRAGATKLQHLRLGKGTSQHVLIAGKTGSGKSTLLHALITNVALRYSPREVELYLIDFKKGVEFKTYATHGLAHARVVAVESEREFGLSVLQRLDAELKLRGEMFRALGAQDVASYRAAHPEEDLPRILLLVDEFQEFFIEDDKIAQESALLLDRLVRQGRAFGIHVHLGSQTLSGAYSLARSTLGQMAVRVALQCSEADAHLILSEENSAARLLSRPGEAIYNDANGLVEGNHIFQVVWLGDALREAYLKRLARLAEERGYVPKHPQIVFEGNTSASLNTNSQLSSLLEALAWGDVPRSVPAWLGDAIAIKAPTTADFQPQSGSHLLLVGQQEEAAVGIITSSILSLAAQHPTGSGSGARFVVFDGIPSDSPFAGKLARLANVVPHDFRTPGIRGLAASIGEIHEEVERRRADEAADMTAIYLIVNDLTRFRDLRKGDDDFGFSGSFGGGEKALSTAKQFVAILREGPAVNVHAIVWCDTMSNLNRTFDRQGIGEFEMRILFQMSASDSSQLIDSPVAGRLGPNRAFFYSEEQGCLEKFRPYGIPDDAYLAGVKARLGARAPGGRPGGRWGFTPQ